jgi:hypothetical protein
MSTVVFDNLHMKYTQQPVISWKGKTFNQITSSIQKNTRSTTSGIHNLFLPNPMKIYRREIATVKTTTTCSRRASTKIDEFNRPGGSIVNTKFLNDTNGLVNNVDVKLPNNTCEEPGTCIAFLSPALNAKRRCRSAGMVHKKYGANNLPKYFTDNKQYLYSRNHTFDQNQFNYPISDPSYCVTQNPNNVQFATQGAVTSSSLIARVRYNAIQTSAAQMKNPLGIATSNALAYGVPENGYTVKDIIGYPNPRYPNFKNGSQRNCTDNHKRIV